MECKTFRMTGHSAHDAAHYVPSGPFDEWGKLDPITRLEARMLEEGWAERAELDRRHAAVRQEVDEAVAWAREEPVSRPGDPARRRLREPVAMPTTYLEAIREGLWEEMERDPNVFLLGEDIGVYGGAFKVTAGFLEHFGEKRVVDTPISESAIVGAAIGAGLMGLRPVAEMQFADFISCGFDQIVNFAAKCRYRWGARGAHGGARALGRRHSRRAVSLAEPRDVVRADARPEGGGAGHRLRRQGADQVGHPRQRSGDLLRAQGPLPQDQGRPAGRGLHGADRQGQSGAAKART